MKGPAWRRAVTALLLLFVCVCACRLAAIADPVELPTGDAPVIWAQLEGGSLTVRTWQRSGVAVEADPGVEYRHVDANRFEPSRIPQQIMLWSQSVRTADGELTLPPESFILPPLTGEAHDGVTIAGDGNVTITVPATTALIVANVRRGSVTVQDYRNGVLVTHVGVGSAALDRFEGVAAVQVGTGPVRVRDSTFARLRARTGRGNMIFARCRATQIQATSIAGSILYDDGAFEPGLARFESELGSVALGIAGSGVQIGAHSDSGRIFSGFGPNEATVRRETNDLEAVVAGGGPVVTVTSNRGAVILYRGSLRAHPNLDRAFPRRPTTKTS